MVDQTGTTPHGRQLRIDLNAITARLAILADTPCPHCEPAMFGVAADITELTAEVARLSAALALTRRVSANRLAAIRTTLSAERDGDPDPLGFLRDELAESCLGTSVSPVQRWGWR